MWYQQYVSAGGSAPDLRTGRREDVAIELAGMPGNTADQCGRGNDLATGLTQATNTTNAAGNAHRNGMTRSRPVDPKLGHAFAKAWAGLWLTTGPCQHFYRKEFELAHARDARLAHNRQRVETMLAPTHGDRSQPSPDAAVERIGADVASWLETIAATGSRGWHFRAARDAMSLIGNVSLLAVIAACFYREGEAGDGAAAGHTRGMAAANTPFGVPWADWTLLAFEGAKGVLTQSLGSPTLIRHHAVDEVLKRMDAGCRLLEACLPSPSSPSSPSDTSSWRGTLGTLTRSRDVATLFTFANTGIPPARLGLWVPSWFSGPSGTADGYRGILRVAGLMLDSCRAVTSLLGTWARNEAFTHDARSLTQRWQSLCERLANVPRNEVATMLDRVDRVTQLSQHCDTALLARIAADPTLRECLLGSRHPLTVSQMALACRESEIPCHVSRVDGLNYLSLNPAESPWGQHWSGDAWESGGATPVRASYRLLLLYQHWSAALLERVVSASACTQASNDPEGHGDDPVGVNRSRASVAYIDVESTAL